MRPCGIAARWRSDRSLRVLFLLVQVGTNIPGSVRNGSQGVTLPVSTSWPRRTLRPPAPSSKENMAGVAGRQVDVVEDHHDPAPHASARKRSSTAKLRCRSRARARPMLVNSGNRRRHARCPEGTCRSAYSPGPRWPGRQGSIARPSGAPGPSGPGRVAPPPGSSTESRQRRSSAGSGLQVAQAPWPAARRRRVTDNTVTGRGLDRRRLARVCSRVGLCRHRCPVDHSRLRPLVVMFRSRSTSRRPMDG